MADLVTRLILDNDNFNTNLHRSSDQIAQFQRMGSSVVGTLGKFAGAIGTITGGLETFNRVINSNMSTQNQWNDLMGTCKTTVDSFFSSLTHGDWSVFEKGIKNAIRLSRDYSTKMRQLKSNMVIGDTHMSQFEKDLNKFENQATDERNDKATREKGYKEFNKVGDASIKFMKDFSESAKSYMKALMEDKGLPLTTDARDMIFNYLDTSTPGGQRLLKYELYKKKRDELAITENNNRAANPTLAAATKKKYEEEAKEYKKKTGKDMGSGDPAAYYKALVEEMEKEDSNLKSALQFKNKFNEDETRDLLEISDRIIGYEDREESIIKQKMDLAKDFDKNGHLKPQDKDKDKTPKPAPKPEPKPAPVLPLYNYPDAQPMKGFGEFSIADYEDRLVKVKEEIRQAGSQELRIKLSLEAQGIEKKIEQLSDYTKDQFGEAIEDTFSGEGAFGLAIENALGKMDTKANISFQFDGLYDALDAFQSLSSAIAECNTKSKDLQKGMVVASTAASIAMLIATMVEKSKKSLTIWDWIAGVTAGTATVVAMAAQLKSISAYATGGIVEGNSTIGDMNIARVNSGEMILNNHQQRNLFSLLNNGGSTGGGNGKVEFKIAGRELVGVLKNYNTKISKVQ